MYFNEIENYKVRIYYLLGISRKYPAEWLFHVEGYWKFPYSMIKNVENSFDSIGNCADRKYQQNLNKAIDLW